MDGANSLTVPAPGMTKLVGGIFYRLTLQNAATAEQVVVTAAPADVINVLPLGSSITEGVSGQGATYTGGGYRSQLYQSLVNDGRFTPNFVGSSTILDNSATAGYNVLSGANQLHHEGHGGYQTSDILANLNADSGIGGNDGGFWLAAGNGIEPDDVLLSIGGNDYGANGLETVEPVNRTDAIITAIETLRTDGSRRGGEPVLPHANDHRWGGRRRPAKRGLQSRRSRRRLSARFGRAPCFLRGPVRRGDPRQQHEP